MNISRSVIRSVNKFTRLSNQYDEYLTRHSWHNDNSGKKTRISLKYHFSGIHSGSHIYSTSLRATKNYRGALTAHGGSGTTFENSRCTRKNLSSFLCQVPSPGKPDPWEHANCSARSGCRVGPFRLYRKYYVILPLISDSPFNGGFNSHWIARKLRNLL